jgi:3,4-dihydroxy 2-butanone 4-phosphate synthase / GTP cyclohydrolase II
MHSQNLFNNLRELDKGNMLILLDDSKTPEEAALICLAEHTTPEVVNHMCTHARGIVSVCVPKQIAEQINLPLQKKYRGSNAVTRDYTVSIDAVETTTGISAQERSFSIKKFANTKTADGFVKPGHIFPVIAKKNGLYASSSVIEGAVDIAKMIALEDRMVTVCDILDMEGRMADERAAVELAQKIGVGIVYLSDLLKYKLQIDNLIESKVVTDIKIENYEIRIFKYNFPGGNYEVCFSKLEPEHVNRELQKIRLWLGKGDYRCDEYFPNYFSSIYDTIKEFKNNQSLIIVGDNKSSYTFSVRIIFETIINDVESSLKVLTKEMSY